MRTNKIRLLYKKEMLEIIRNKKVSEIIGKTKLNNIQITEQIFIKNQEKTEKELENIISKNTKFLKIKLNSVTGVSKGNTPL